MALVRMRLCVAFSGSLRPDVVHHTFLLVDANSPKSDESKRESFKKHNLSCSAWLGGVNYTIAYSVAALILQM